MPKERVVVRWNHGGQRYVVGRGFDGKPGLYAQISSGGPSTDDLPIWRPFDLEDLEDVYRALGAEPGEVLHVSIYRIEE